ncbi:MAG: TIGR03986 family type III CRISPR-associated RAMP protein, partial [Bacteroidales bacterium]
MNAPYTFIPLSEDVIFPDWADRISHDMPFSDGLSGEIAYEIEAETPIYIRNSNSISGESNLFFNHHLDESGKRRYFIPGTSLKGMVRSLVEALSFSKLTQLNKGRYSFRDMKDQVNYPLFTPAEAKKIRCGWLTMGEDGVCRIDDHGKFFRIGHDEIDANYGSDFVECFKDRGRATKGNSTINDDAKWGSFKYNKLQGRSLSSRFSIEERETMNVAHFNQYGDVEGTLVVTGQASVRKEDRNGKLSGKFYEFIFPNKSEGVFKLSDQIWKDFLFQAKDKDPNSISEDWKYWKERFNKGERVPVFFRVDPKNSREIMDFGLTMMYRLSYKNSIEDMVPQKHKDSRLDMPEAIFGYTRDKENLRGRVQFSHAFALGEPKDMALVEGVLASPKASYYPNYIEQSQGGKYNTYSDTV